MDIDWNCRDEKRGMYVNFGAQVSNDENMKLRGNPLQYLQERKFSENSILILNHYEVSDALEQVP